MFRENKDHIKVNSPTGLKTFFGIQKVERDYYSHLFFTDGSELKCSIDHLLMNEKKIFIQANHFQTGDFVCHKNGFLMVEKNKFIDEKIDLYDLIDVEGDRTFFTNGFVSHNCEFIGSSDTLINGEKLKDMKSNWKEAPNRGKFELEIHEEAQDDHKYIICVDCAEGKKLDYSAFVVIDMTRVPYKLVAKYHNNEIDPFIFPTVIYHAAKTYNDSEIFIELNSTGMQVAQILFDELAADNIIKTCIAGRKGQTLLTAASLPSKIQLGLKTSPATKRLGCANLKTLIENDKLLIDDKDVIEELLRFVADTTSYSAEEGYHDDLVMCLVLFGWLQGQAYFRHSQNGDIRTILQEEKLMTTDDELLFRFTKMTTGGDDDVFYDDDESYWRRDKSSDNFGGFF